MGAAPRQDGLAGRPGQVHACLGEDKCKATDMPVQHGQGHTSKVSPKASRAGRSPSDGERSRATVMLP
eukprot:2848757-Alexandrium_andersonii.AAC.1